MARRLRAIFIVLPALKLTKFFFPGKLKNRPPPRPPAQIFFGWWGKKKLFVLVAGGVVVVALVALLPPLLLLPWFFPPPAFFPSAPPAPPLVLVGPLVLLAPLVVVVPLIFFLFWGVKKKKRAQPARSFHFPSFFLLAAAASLSGSRARAVSALGHKRTNHRGPKSTVVRFGPKADKRMGGWQISSEQNCRRPCCQAFPHSESAAKLLIGNGLYFANFSECALI